MFYFPQRKCSVLIPTPGRSSTSELRSASQCRSRFFQYHLRRTPSALSHSPCTPCPLRRKTERVIREDENTVPGFDTEVWFILKESSGIINVWNLFCFHWNVPCFSTRAWTQVWRNQTGKGREWRHYKITEMIVEN